MADGNGVTGKGGREGGVRVKAGGTNAGTAAPAMQAEEEEGGGAPEWVVTFSDMMSLLLCFFVLLFSMSTIEKDKFKELALSLQSALGVDEVPQAGTREGLEMKKHEAEAKPEAVDELGGMIKKEMNDIKSNVEEFIVKNQLGGQVNAKVDGRGVVITISDVVLFPAGEAEINPEASQLMEKLKDLLQEFHYRVRVDGHTDDVPIHTDKYPSNWELSAARASRIVRYFIENGVAPERLSAQGFAEFHPLVDNSTPENRGKNRRVEIVYTREAMEQEMAKKRGLAKDGS